MKSKRRTREESKNQAEKKKRRKRKKKKRAIKDAEIKANDDWISENKENLLQEFKVLLNGFDDKINDLENERKNN